MYILFLKITNHTVSFFATSFYALSPAFLGYADSIANQPIDDLLRFAFMLLIVIATQTIRPKKQKILIFASAWAVQFLLSLSSFDSVFFVYLWLIGWYLIDPKLRGFKWKIFLLFALAPLLAHSLQFMQNVWYLGLDTATIDIKETFLNENKTLDGYGRIGMLFHSLRTLFEYFYYYYYKAFHLIILTLFVLYNIYLKLLSGDNRKEFPPIRLLIILFSCGLFFVAILPKASEAHYHIRQFIPFISLLVGGIIWSIIRQIKDFIQGNVNNLKKTRASYILVASVLIVVVWFPFFRGKWEPYYMSKDHPDILLSKEIKSIETKYDPVVFTMNGFEEIWDINFVPGYPQIDPISEYFAGSIPILCFTSTTDLTEDLVYMTRELPHRFSPILVTDNPKYIENVLYTLDKKSALTLEEPSTAGYNFTGKYILNLTDILKWDE